MRSSSAIGRSRVRAAIRCSNVCVARLRRGAAPGSVPPAAAGGKDHHGPSPAVTQAQTARRPDDDCRARRSTTSDRCAWSRKRSGDGSIAPFCVRHRWAAGPFTNNRADRPVRPRSGRSAPCRKARSRPAAPGDRAFPARLGRARRAPHRSHSRRARAREPSLGGRRKPLRRARAVTAANSVAIAVSAWAPGRPAATGGPPRTRHRARRGPRRAGARPRSTPFSAASAGPAAKVTSGAAGLGARPARRARSSPTRRRNS